MSQVDKFLNPRKNHFLFFFFLHKWTAESQRIGLEICSQFVISKDGTQCYFSELWGYPLYSLGQEEKSIKMERNSCIFLWEKWNNFPMTIIERVETGTGLDHKGSWGGEMTSLQLFTHDVISSLWLIFILFVALFSRLISEELEPCRAKLFLFSFTGCDICLIVFHFFSPGIKINPQELASSLLYVKAPTRLTWLLGWQM